MRTRTILPAAVLLFAPFAVALDPPSKGGLPPPVREARDEA
jgi:hypothetical protein